MTETLRSHVLHVLLLVAQITTKVHHGRKHVASQQALGHLCYEWIVFLETTIKRHRAFWFVNTQFFVNL